MVRLLLLLCILCVSLPAHALSLIRDAETEAFLREVANPIFNEAGLAPKNIRIYIVQSPVLNAFVAGGQNLFLHTGLLTWSDDPRVVAGVIAHETGHIAGGHLVRGRDEMLRAGIGTMLSYVLGAATIVAGAPDAGQAILTGGSHLAQSAFLRYSRSNEESADQAAVTYLDKVDMSADGLVALLEELNAEQHRQFEQVNPYSQTHPLSAERIQFVKNAEKNSRHAHDPAPEEMQERYARITAKIRAFIDDPVQVERRYLSSDHSFAAQYARVVLAHRKGNLPQAMGLLDTLLSQHPLDGYLYELKGQVLYENGKVEESIAAYQQAIDLLPDEPLIRLGLGVSLARSEDEANVKASIAQFRKVTEAEKENAIAWHEMGVAYGKLGQLGHSYLALAEEAMVQHNRRNAYQFIGLAKRNPTGDATAELRLQDMEAALKNWKDDEVEKEEE